MSYSVLMSIYEKEKPDFFDESLKSVFEQTLFPYEVIIVKDGFIPPSLDEVLTKYLGKYPNIIKIIPLEQNQGLGFALNYGLKFCTQKYVGRMDTDDICLPSRFEKQLNFLKEHDDIDIVGTWIDEFEKDKDVIVSNRKLPVTHEKIYNFAKKRNPLNHMTVFFKKDAVLESGGYMPFLWNEDYYLWVRMLVNGKKFENLPESLVLVRAGAGMISRRGGLKYFQVESKLQKEFYLMGFINKKQWFMNLVTRGIFRIVPNSLRKVLYMKFLRG